MKRRFEFKDEKSDKYWEYETRDMVPASESVKITWGKTGSTGQSQFTDIHVAEKRAQEKLRKGYVEVPNKAGYKSETGTPYVSFAVPVRTSDDSDDMWDELIKNIKAQ